MGGSNKGKYLVPVRSERECEMFLRYLRTYHNVNQLYHNTEGSMRQLLDQAVQNLTQTEEQREQLISEMKAFSDQQLISEAEFDWLKNNPIAGFIAWYRIQGIFPQAPSILEGISESIYRQLKLNPNPISPKERYEIVINFFDSYSGDISTKYQQILSYQKEWNDLYLLRKQLTWISNKDEEQLDWFEKQLIKHTLTTPLTFSPNNSSEQHIALISIFLLSPVHPAEKKLALFDIKNAWRQKQFRQEQKAKKKKSLNTHLKEDTKEMLSELAAEEGVNMTEMLERLINRAYERATS